MLDSVHGCVERVQPGRDGDGDGSSTTIQHRLLSLTMRARHFFVHARLHSTIQNTCTMIHEDVCWTIVHMHYDCGLSVEEIAHLVWTPKHEISIKSVERIVDRFEETGEVRR